MKTNLTFNKHPKYKSKCLYNFNRYLNTFEKSSYVLFVRSYYKLKPSAVKYYKKLPFSKGRRRSC